VLFKKRIEEEERGCIRDKRNAPLEEEGV